MATKKIKTEKETPSVVSKGVKNATNGEAAVKPLAKKVTEKATAKKAKATEEQKEEIAPKATNGTATEKPKQVKIKATKPAATKEITAEPTAPAAEPTIKKAAKKSPAKKDATVEAKPTAAVPARSSKTLSVRFQLRYSTHFGETLFVSGNNPAFGESEQGLLMQYLNDQYWYADVQLPAVNEEISYSYKVVNHDGTVKTEAGSQKVINPSKLAASDVAIFDLWEENANYIDTPSKKQGATSVVFNVKAPSLKGHQALFISGNVDELGNWKQEDLQVLSKTSDGNWAIAVDLTNANFPISYKYGVYDVQDKKFVEFEAGEDRFFAGTDVAKQLIIVSDGYVNLPY